MRALATLSHFARCFAGSRSKPRPSAGTRFFVSGRHHPRRTPKALAGNMVESSQFAAIGMTHCSRNFEAFTGAKNGHDDIADTMSDLVDELDNHTQLPAPPPPTPIAGTTHGFATARNLNEMSFRETLITLGNRAATSARNTGATLLRAVRPGEREPAPNFAPDVMSPWPNTDRFPIILGSQLTFQYIGATKRQARFGYRLQWVDLLDELIERDLSAIGNLTGRILATAGGRIQVVSAATRFPLTDLGEAERARVEAIRQAAGLSASLPTMSEDERILADQIAAHVQQQIDGLPRKPQTLAQQLWAIYFGVTANELLGHARPTNGACASCTSFTRADRLSRPRQLASAILGSRARCAIRTGLERLLDARAFRVRCLRLPEQVPRAQPMRFCTHTRRTTG